MLREIYLIEKNEIVKQFLKNKIEIKKFKKLKQGTTQQTKTKREEKLYFIPFVWAHSHYKYIKLAKYDL
ncbi:hypothetical protein COF44_30100 [Bacillus toyonensis]|nr:hypothetical protein COL67_07105 [Bacillus toyonensis]PGB41542.1 hypothetical protein COM07_03940 [Bacillus toyonensis]PGE40427.1 hypothetical protein COM60_04380 [Bacillus toyonensis]PHC93171.1 hypothetical protein COF44_30100 [Bacillus toyonensis]